LPKSNSGITDAGYNVAAGFVAGIGEPGGAVRNERRASEPST